MPNELKLKERKLEMQNLDLNQELNGQKKPKMRSTNISVNVISPNHVSPVSVDIVDNTMQATIGVLELLVRSAIASLMSTNNALHVTTISVEISSTPE
jgi:hypothetical protein